MARLLNVDVLVNPTSGLTADESEVLEALMAAWMAYVRLPQVHPDHLTDFRQAIHTAQRILAIRIAQRYFPETWGPHES